MNFIQKSPEVLFASGPLARVQAEDIARLKSMASASPLRRARICAHMSVEDAIQEMLIVHARGVYVIPHRHPDKCISMVSVEGECDMVFFNDDGGVNNVVRLGALGTGGVVFQRIINPPFYSLIPRTEHFVLLETINGPFRPEHNVSAPWAPKEPETAKVSEYMRRLEQVLADRLA
ncbi:WbuC family cupin fold metalloprotein [Humidesulfovibrio sp.]